jgi:hypothetical protein
MQDACFLGLDSMILKLDDVLLEVYSAPAWHHSWAVSEEQHK